MKEKTISYLNSKVWYRLLKVAFVFSFLLISVFTSWMMYEDGKPREVIDSSKTLITCDNGATFYASDKGFYFYSSYVSSWDDSQLKVKCGISPDVKIYNYSQLSQLPKNYQIDFAYKTEGSWVDVCKYITIGLLIVILIFELAKRIFYYIVLGSFFPPKKAENIENNQH